MLNLAVCLILDRTNEKVYCTFDRVGKINWSEQLAYAVTINGIFSLSLSLSVYFPYLQNFKYT